MKYTKFFVGIALVCAHCSKHSAVDGVTVLPVGDTVLRAGDQVLIKWYPSGGSLPVIVTLENNVAAGTPSECLLIPEHQFGAHGVTEDDGEDRYYLPWRYSDEGRILYGDTIGTQTCTIRVVVARYDTLVDVWREGTLRVRSAHTFAIYRSIYPDGCRGPVGASATTGQDCY